MLPLQFHPVLKRIRWGGRRLGTVLGKPIGDANDYAESWEIADCGADQSTVAEGPFEGWTLSRLVAAEPTALFGSDRGPSHFPLLIKFLDCNDRLSVQVHPNDEQARRMGAARMARPRRGSSSKRVPTAASTRDSNRASIGARSSGTSMREPSRNVSTVFPRGPATAFSFPRGPCTRSAREYSWPKHSNPAM